MSLISAAAQVQQRISYLEAWQLWFNGDEVPSDSMLWFLSIRSWGRTGQIVAFLGGMTVILDLIGPIRLRRLGALWKNMPEDSIGPIAVFLLIGYAALAVIASAVDEGLGILAIVLALPLVIGTVAVADWILSALDKPEPARAIRYTGLALLFLGFHFSLLSS